MQRRSSRFLALALAALTLFTGLQFSVAQAAMISTTHVVMQEQTQFDRSQLQQRLSRADAVSTLQAMGVDPALVQERVAAMTDAELQQFNQQVDEMQAGSGALGVILLVFLVLILLDLLGVTDVFPAIRSL